MKLVAYPFQKYGMLDGVVKQVGADAQEKLEAANPAQETAYRALTSLTSGHLESQGRQLRLVPGMRVNAEIHLGTRSVIEYLLSPVQEVAHEAGRARRCGKCSQYGGKKRTLAPPVGIAPLPSPA